MAVLNNDKLVGAKSKSLGFAREPFDRFPNGFVSLCKCRCSRGKKYKKESDVRERKAA